MLTKNKNQNGGEINSAPIYILGFNLIMLLCKFIMFKYLYHNTTYSNVLYLFCGMMLLSIFTIIFIVWGLYKTKTSIFHFFIDTYNVSDFNDPMKQTDKDPTTVARIISLAVLLCVGLLQFITITLFVTIFAKKPSSDNTFILTIENRQKLEDYEIFYVITYVCILCLALAILTPLTSDKNDTIIYYIILFIFTGSLCYFGYNMFVSCYDIYRRTIIKNNKLYQGSDPMLFIATTEPPFIATTKPPFIATTKPPFVATTKPPIITPAKS